MRNQNKYDSLISLLQHFSDEQVCLQHLEELRWPDGNPVCPHCDHEKCYRFRDGKRFKCAGCRKQFTVKVGTIFESSNIQLSKWFAAIYLATSHKKGISSHQLAKDIEISQKSAWHMLHRIREMVKANNPDLILDPHAEYEADEHFHGGKEKNKHASKRTPHTQGRSTQTKTPIFGIVKRGGDVIAAKPVKDTSSASLLPVVMETIPAGSKVYTDEWYAYRGLQGVYQHGIVKHSSGEYVVQDIHTNTIESFWACLSRSVIGIYHHVSHEHVESYCDEAAFRYNTRKATESGRFDLAVAQSDGKQLKWDDLVKRGNAV